ncbi:HAD-like domain-containing protein [Gigaspora rosea]|uniref:HAD-like domain-containing protein n=1 Tax=Gigaspora rosea TaxID=44941 RepID=A0A397UUY0_9GLOM|nr:HAD-like domain-containing protein [Gigaspora rosea]
MHYPVGLLVSDFDETITQHDSICEIAKLAYDKRERQGKCPLVDEKLAPNDNDAGGCPPPWSYFVEKYFRERKEHIKFWCEKQPERTLQDHYKLLESLREVEKKSLNRVEKYQCLNGIRCDELFERGERIPKRDGVTDVLKNYLPKCTNGNVSRYFYILSTNWSRDMLLGSLKDLVGVKREHILSNDLVFDDTDRTTGKVKHHVLSALDKLSIFSKLEIPRGTISAYIGDSDTDLPCLLEANIGIIMGNNNTLSKYCAKFGIEIVEGLVGKIDTNDLITTKKRHYKLFRVQSWKEISDSGLLDW